MLDDLFESFIKNAAKGGSKKSSQRGGGSADPWMDMLEGFLGGAAQKPTGSKGKGTSPMEDLSSLGDMSSLLEMFLGGGQQSGIGSNPMLAPFTEELSERLGISPQMASVIISFAFSLLMSKLQQGGGTIGKETKAKEGFDLDDLLDDDYLDSQGITTQLADQTGMNQDTAKESLKEAVVLLSGQSTSYQEGGPNKSGGASELEDLLDTCDE